MVPHTSTEFVGFLANPAACKRGRAVQMARGQQRRGLLEHLSCTWPPWAPCPEAEGYRTSTGQLAQAEANRALRREVTRRKPK